MGKTNLQGKFEINLPSIELFLFNKLQVTNLGIYHFWHAYELCSVSFPFE